MVNGERIKKIPANSGITILVFGNFLYNGFVFWNTQGNSHPLVGSLFNMIIVLLIIFYKFHKEELINEKDDIIIQTK